MAINVCACYADLFCEAPKPSCACVQHNSSGACSVRCGCDCIKIPNVVGHVDIVLHSPAMYDGSILNEETREFIPHGSKWSFDIGRDGCWKSCELPANSSLTPQDCDGKPLTWYEATPWINGNRGPTERFILDENVKTFPDSPHCVNLSDVTMTTVPTQLSDYLTQKVRQAESPWIGTEGCGIEIVPGDVVEGCSIAGNGHSPAIGIKLSADPTNDLTFDKDCGLLYNWTCDQLNACQINDIGDVDCSNPVLGDTLVFDGTNFVCEPKTAAFQCSDLGTCEIEALCNVICESPLDGYVLVRRGGDWICEEPPPSTIVVPEDTDCIDLSIVGVGSSINPYRISANPILSTTTGNQLTCGVGGLHSRAYIDTFDSSCINLTLTGVGTAADSYKLTADIVLSPLSDNVLTCNADGLYVPAPKEFACTDLANCNLDDLGNVTCACDAATANDECRVLFCDGDVWTCNDLGALMGLGFVSRSNCIEVTKTGAGTNKDPYLLTIDQRISAQANNAITCESDGLYVCMPDEFSCADLANCSLESLGNFNCDAPNNGEVITYQNGSWVCQALPAVPDLVVTTNGNSTGVTHSGTSNHTVNVVTLSGDTGQLLSLGVDGGLFLECADITNCFSVNIRSNSSCLAVGGSGSTGDPFTLDLVVSPTAGNTLTCAANGLFVPTPTPETITTFINNNDGTYTYTNEAGAVTTLDTTGSLSSITDNNDGTVTHDNGNGLQSIIDVCCIIKDNCDVTLVANPDGSFTHTSIGNIVTNIPAPPAETVTTLVQNGNAFTYTSEDGTVTNFNTTGSRSTVTDNSDGTVTHNDGDGNDTVIDICAIVTANCSDNLIVNPDGSLTHTSLDGTTTTVPAAISETVTTLVDNGDSTYTYTSEDGTQSVVNAGGSTSTLTDNNDGTITHNDGNGNLTAIDICAIVEGNCSDIFTDNADGTFTHTTVDGTAVTVTTITPVSVLDTDTIDATITGTGAPADPFIISGDVIVDPDCLNATEARADGIFTPVSCFSVGSASSTAGGNWQPFDTGVATDTEETIVETTLVIPNNTCADIQALMFHGHHSENRMEADISIRTWTYYSIDGGANFNTLSHQMASGDDIIGETLLFDVEDGRWVVLVVPPGGLTVIGRLTAEWRQREAGAVLTDDTGIFSGPQMRLSYVAGTPNC